MLPAVVRFSPIWIENVAIRTASVVHRCCIQNRSFVTICYLFSQWLHGTSALKNIVLLTTDTFRFDNLFDYAKKPLNTPSLDAFCETRATSITNFYTASFPTIPNRTDIATGITGWSHYGWQPIDVSGPNHIAKTLRRQGYATQLVCDCPHLFNSRFQFAFDAAYQHRGQEGDKHLLPLNDPITTKMPLDKTRTYPLWKNKTLVDAHRWVNRYFNVEEETFAAKTAATATRWLEENYKAEPFFLWVDFFDLHEPWDPPEYLVRKYDPDYRGQPMIHCNYGPATDYSDAELHNLWAHYAAESELVDRHLGRVLQKIDDLRLWDDTIVIVTSDHGTSIGEHNRTGKSNISDNDERYWPIYPEVGKLPFLIARGDVPQGQIREFIAQPPDISPTLAELADFQPETQRNVDGRSFYELLKNGRGSHRELAVSASFVPIQENGRCPVHATTPFATDGVWGYAPVGAFGEPEFYNLELDPWAETNVIEKHPEELSRIQRKFERHLRSEANSNDDVLSCWTPE